MSLGDLSLDVLSMVAAFAGPKATCAMGATCRALRDVMRRTEVWRAVYDAHLDNDTIQTPENIRVLLNCSATHFMEAVKWIADPICAALKAQCMWKARAFYQGLCKESERIMVMTTAQAIQRREYDGIQPGSKVVILKHRPITKHGTVDDGRNWY